MEQIMRMSDLPVGAAGVIARVDAGNQGQGRRLEDLGLIVGTVVRVERRAPLGDPRIYEVRRARLAMRRADAQMIDVELIDPAAESTNASDGGTDVAL
jgi:ferrous iron transport protein A